MVVLVGAGGVWRWFFGEVFLTFVVVDMAGFLTHAYPYLSGYTSVFGTHLYWLEEACGVDHGFTYCAVCIVVG